MNTPKTCFHQDFLQKNNSCFKQGQRKLTGLHFLLMHGVISGKHLHFCCCWSNWKVQCYVPMMTETLVGGKNKVFHPCNNGLNELYCNRTGYRKQSGIRIKELRVISRCVKIITNNNNNNNNNNDLTERLVKKKTFL